MPAMVVNPKFVGNSLVGGFQNGLLATGMKIRVYTNNVAPDPNNPSPTQFTEATFPGYAAVNPTFGTLSRPPGGGWALADVLVNFNPSGSGTPETAYGYMISDSTDWVIAEQFDTPFPLVDNTSNLGLVLAVRIADSGITGDNQPLA